MNLETFSSRLHNHLEIRDKAFLESNSSVPNPDLIKRYRMIVGLLSKVAKDVDLETNLKELDSSPVQKSLKQKSQTGLKILPALSGVAKGFRNTLSEAYIEPLKQFIDQIKKIDNKGIIENNLDVGLNNMIEMFFGLVAVIPKIYKDSTRKEISKEKYQEIGQSVKDLIEDLSRMNSDLFFKYLKNIIRDLQLRSPLSIFPSFDFNSAYFKIEDEKIFCSDRLFTNLVGEVGNSLKDQTVLGCPITDAVLPGGQSVLHACLDAMMKVLEVGFFPYWDDFCKNGYGGLAQQEILQRVNLDIKKEPDPNLQ